MTGRKLIALYSIHQSMHWFATGLLVPVMALELPTGRLADSFGRRKIYLYSSSLSAFSPWASPGHCLPAHRVVLLLLVSTAALGIALSGLENFWQPQLRGILAGEFKTWLFGVLSAGYFLSASGRESDRDAHLQIVRQQIRRDLVRLQDLHGGHLVRSCPAGNPAAPE